MEGPEAGGLKTKIKLDLEQKKTIIKGQQVKGQEAGGLKTKINLDSITGHLSSV